MVTKMSGRKSGQLKSIIFLCLNFVYLIKVTDGSTSDWSQNCPTGCSCTWIGGKKTAECRDAGFHSIPTGLSDEVQVLDLRGNTITSLGPYTFSTAGLLNLNRIRLSNCKIERVDRFAFANLKLLLELDLSENRIRELIMETFETNERLRELQFNSNPLMILLGISFPPLIRFQKLSFRNCSLSQLPRRGFEKLINLQQLDLSGNDFQTLSEDLFVHLQNLKALGLSDNPWNCDCKLKSFRDWALSHKLLQVQPPKCSLPDRLAGFEWSQLLATHFACSPQIAILQVSGQPTETYIVGDIGKSIRLECLVRGNPTPEVRWVKDSVSMTNSTASAQGKSYYVQISGETEKWVNLTIPTSSLGDAGEYVCIGENKGGSAEKNITLNFEDVPSGAGVGIGMGTDGPNSPTTRSWLWILIGGIGALLCLGLLLLLICVCARRPLPKDTRTSSELKNLHQDEPLTKEIEDDSDLRPLTHTGKTPLISPTGTMGGKRFNGPNGDIDSDYPDLLDLPVRLQDSPPGSIASRSTLPDSTQILQPQDLTPGRYADPRQNIIFYTHPHLLLGRRPHSPHSGSVASFASEPPLQPIVPPPHRPGYVTLPRRPRVPSWSPAYSRDTPLSVSPTDSVFIGNPYVKYDNLGPRTTADGSSRHSLNKIGSPNYNSLPFSRSNSARPGSSAASTPNHLQTPLTPHYNFAPIHENEPPIEAEPQLLSPPKKKVPPKPPPKPISKRLGTLSTDVVPEEPSGGIEGLNDGTEV